MLEKNGADFTDSSSHGTAINAKLRDGSVSGACRREARPPSPAPQSPSPNASPPEGTKKYCLIHNQTAFTRFGRASRLLFSTS